jgi:poly(3-hydroxybutyrate) depolymerase
MRAAPSAKRDLPPERGALRLARKDNAMRKISLCLVLLALFAPQARAGVERASLTFAGRDRIYYASVPASGSGPFPLVVLLHGSGGDGAQMIERWKEIAAQEPMALAAPNSLHTAEGWTLRDDGPDFIRGVIEAMEASHPIDPRRLYLFGQSGGAVYALNLGLLESEYFAAVAFHAGGWREPAEYKFADFARRKIPIAMFVGDRDEYFPVDSVERTARVLAERGVPVELHLLAGRRHAYSDVPDDFHDTVWKFLKAKSLDSAPRFTPYRLGGAPMR